MASETPLKRQREDTTLIVSEDQENVQKDVHEEIQETKRQKSSYNHILSLLDEEEDEPTQDISSLVTTLQQEISSENIPDYACDSSSSSSKEDGEDDKERVMRHLLEASDDELGLPNSTEQLASLEKNVGEELFSLENSTIDGYTFGDGLWEIEDEAANYYTMLHSELFL